MKFIWTPALSHGYSETDVLVQPVSIFVIRKPTSLNEEKAGACGM